MILCGILVLNLLGLNYKQKTKKKTGADDDWFCWPVPAVEKYWCSGIMVMFQAKFCFGSFKGVERNSQCSGALLHRETLSFSSGVFKTCRDATKLLLTERNPFSTKGLSSRPPGRPPWGRWDLGIFLLSIVWIQVMTLTDSFTDSLAWGSRSLRWTLVFTLLSVQGFVCHGTCCSELGTESLILPGLWQHAGGRISRPRCKPPPCWLRLRDSAA